MADFLPANIPPAAWLAAQAATPGAQNIGTIGYERGASVAQRIAQALDAGGLTSGGSPGGTAARAAAQTRLAQAAAGSQGLGPIAAPTATRAAQQAVSSPSFVGRAATAGGIGTPGTGAAGSLGGAAQTAGGLAAGGRLAGLLASRGAAPTWLTSRLAGAPVTGLGARSLGVGSLGRAGAYGAGGYLAGQGIEALFGHSEGTIDDAARNAATGAGLGAGVGSLIFPGVGTAIGFGVGGVGGAIHGLLTGGGSDTGDAADAYVKQAEKFNETFTEYGVSPEFRDQFMMQFALATDGLKKGEVNDIAKQMRTMLPQLIIEEDAAQEQERSRAAMFAAAQAWMGPMMQDAMGRSTGYADQLSQSMINSAKQIPDPAARAFAIEDANRIKLDTASQQAYGMQMMMSLPGLYGMNTQTGQNGVPAMDFSSIVNATPIAQPNGQTMPMGQMGQQYGQQQPTLQSALQSALTS